MAKETERARLVSDAEKFFEVKGIPKLGVNDSPAEAYRKFHENQTFKVLHRSTRRAYAEIIAYAAAVYLVVKNHEESERLFAGFAEIAAIKITQKTKPAALVCRLFIGYGDQTQGAKDKNRQFAARDGRVIIKLIKEGVCPSSMPGEIARRGLVKLSGAEGVAGSAAVIAPKPCTLKSPSNAHTSEDDDLKPAFQLKQLSQLVNSAHDNVLLVLRVDSLKPLRLRCMRKYRFTGGPNWTKKLGNQLIGLVKKRKREFEKKSKTTGKKSPPSGKTK